MPASTRSTRRETTTDSRPHAGAAHFVTTRWSVVLAAARRDTLRSREALSRLCETYWYPLYVYVRRRGFGPHDAQDLTQEFFARLLRKNYMAVVQRERGKFRSFLLTALTHFLADEWDRLKAQKRDFRRVVPLDMVQAETRYTHELADDATAEKAFDRQWALALLEEVFHTLQSEYEAAGKGALFAALRFCLSGESGVISYAELARDLQTTEGAVKVAVHRLRQRYRELLRASVADTVAGPEAVEEELRSLFKALAR